MTADRPRVALTMGDVAGIGPEVCARACVDPQILAAVNPIVFGHPDVLERAVQLLQLRRSVQPIDHVGDAETSDDTITCYNPGSDDVVDVAPATVDARAGRAAYDYLVAATHAALDHQIDAIVTAPLNKAALRAAGLNYPGHTEILAQECGVSDFGMMLYMPPGENVLSPHGLGVVHVTLHTSIRSVPDLLTTTAIREKIGLMQQFMQTMGCDPPRLAVCALNPHAGEEGLFGNEEAGIIAPAVVAAVADGLNVTGPLPADTLMQRACRGEFDGVIAMYHDQGHIALKLLGFESAVNVTLGLPIIRTSPSHGTAFDIAWQGTARMDGMQQAVRVAAMLARGS
ncbi:4-hydroxythreonine-4-phosphate dehydrogenase [Symmachiella dynata]|uniref:4-hydroxythreonine-4-phosphate dehydrogenase n=1 Tax=Symmachiella dynata TaxID=2527995 RepID=A0A517ZMF2_9PLAN|nr:4-hydroxythreonine-4-phosphate dehydrogenase PdxA [Symmachiella dynata]QDU43658.1 4-hydroxythreonine-4-phosphate dehydrogenase [Symmachiella dynata]